MENVNYNVPFYSNTADGAHCFQAALKMVLKYFLPEQDFSWQELEKITAKAKGLWTWPMAGLLWLQDQGFDVKNIEIFDYEKFIKRDGDYLLEFYGKEVGKAQIKHSNLVREINFAKKFLKKISIEKRLPEIEDIKKFLGKGYLVVLNVNSRALNERLGYSGHFVVVKGFNENSFILHDPGLPAVENRKVKFQKLDKAWAYPNKTAKDLMALKKP